MLNTQTQLAAYRSNLLINVRCRGAHSTHAATVTATTFQASSLVQLAHPQPPRPLFSEGSLGQPCFGCHNCCWPPPSSWCCHCHCLFASCGAPAIMQRCTPPCSQATIEHHGVITGTKRMHSAAYVLYDCRPGKPDTLQVPIHTPTCRPQSHKDVPPSLA